MDLSERQKQILQAIIEDYIATAMPVGSRTISKTFALSSATIRNEMSDLEDLGYLEQPHTSAGRVPSEKAYKFYVENLMSLAALNQKEIDYIRTYYEKRIDETGEVLSDAARVISELTQYVSVIVPPKVNTVNVSSIQLMPVNPTTAMVVLLTDSGMLQNTPIILPRAMRPEELASLSNMLNTMFAGKSVSEIHPGAQIQVENEIADQRQIFDAVCSVLESRLADRESDVVVGGASNVLAHQEYADLGKARGFLKLLEEKDRLGELLENNDMEVRVRIGKETGIGDDVSVVTATYTVGGKSVGKIGVIGPTRMQYDKVLSVLEYMGRTLSKVFNPTESTALEEGKHEEKQ